MTTAAEGRLLAGRYLLGEPVEAGAALWRAHDQALDVPVDVRRLDGGGPGADGGAEDQREARVSAARQARDLVLPGIASVVDVLEEDEDVYVVTEAVPGRPLPDALHETGPLTEASAAQLGVCVLDALEPLHAVGLAHGDLRPATVRVTDDQEVVLTGDSLVPAAAAAGSDLPAVAEVLAAALPGQVSPGFARLLAGLQEGRVNAAEARSALLALSGDAPVDDLTGSGARSPAARQQLRAFVVAVGTVATVALLAAGSAALVAGDRDAATSVAVAATGAAEPSAGAGEPDDVAAGDPVTRPADGPLGPAVVPAGWSTYRDPNDRYALGYPPGWEQRPDRRGARFVSGSGLSSLLVVNRAGPAVDAREQALAAGRALAQTKRDYAELRSEGTTFRGVPAFELEATFSEGGVPQRVSVLTFVVDGRVYLVLVQSAARTWDQLDGVQRDLRASFRVPA